MKVLLVTNQLGTLISHDSFADSIHRLFINLNGHGVNTDAIIPFDRAINLSSPHIKHIQKHLTLEVAYKSASHAVDVDRIVIDSGGVLCDVFALKNPIFIEKSAADIDYVAFYNACVVEFVVAGFNTYDILHLFDWQSGMVAYMLEDSIGATRPRTIFTLHKLSHVPQVYSNTLASMGIVPGTHTTLDWDLQDGHIDFLLQGITSADMVITTSPTYAKEIQTAEFGHDYFEILHLRADKLFGVVSGLNYAEFPSDLSLANVDEKKAHYKKQLLLDLGLKATTELVYLYFEHLEDPTNNTHLRILKHLIAENGGVFVSIDAAFAEKHHLNHALLINLLKGADFVLFPYSNYPYGMLPVLCMHYGCVPLANRVGMLADIIIDHHNGLLYSGPSTKNFKKCIDESFKIYSNGHLLEFIKNNLTVSIKDSDTAKSYKSLYDKVLHLL